jgi:hypothetical protein
VFINRQKRGFRLRELEARDLIYITPMASTKNEMPSQGFPSLQIPSLSTTPFKQAALFFSSISPLRSVMENGWPVAADADLIQIGANPGLTNAPLVSNAAVKIRSIAFQTGIAFS